MIDEGEMEVHFWLTRGMARFAGISFTEEMSNGRLSGAGLEGIVQRCRACSAVDCCVEWLARDAALAREAPDFCRIRGDLDLLSRDGAKGGASAQKPV